MPIALWLQRWGNESWKQRPISQARTRGTSEGVLYFFFVISANGRLPRRWVFCFFFWLCLLPGSSALVNCYRLPPQPFRSCSFPAESLWSLFHDRSIFP